METKGAGTSWATCPLCYLHHLSCVRYSPLPSGDQPLRLTGQLWHPQPKTMNIGTFMQNLYLKHVCHWAGQSSWNSTSLHYAEKYKSSLKTFSCPSGFHRGKGLLVGEALLLTPNEGIGTNSQTCLWVQVSVRGPSTRPFLSPVLNTTVTGALKSQRQQCAHASTLPTSLHCPSRGTAGELKDCFHGQFARP